ncbi:hypothetical protein CK503_11095 [Aliifodinibius salipaludis]|uniref:Uncharacterized protein n=1 Tax=Fodinibius salipaludis TaxID=2032627 RepID=A0A2A2GA11_9BACT|nr:outer membrane beta-barrel protein [Aliifodinibius salipaludis]PAU93689.1 hypothetical protein CK503_11095 [Aliifodinibius salipaludis]
MKVKRILAVLATFALMFSMIPEKASAQWSLGASYEIRDEDPQNGFGVRLEREILNKIPVVNFKLRGHFSYFSEDNYVGENQATYGQIENYDYGLAAVGGIPLGLLSPYVGTGLGSTTTDLQNPEGAFEEGSESSVFWNGFVGAEVSPVPALKPFVEYRFQSAESFDELENSVSTSNGRLIFGVSLSF